MPDTPTCGCGEVETTITYTGHHTAKAVITSCPHVYTCETYERAIEGGWQLSDRYTHRKDTP